MPKMLTHKQNKQYPFLFTSLYNACNPHKVLEVGTPIPPHSFPFLNILSASLYISIMLEGTAIVGETDMLHTMQQEALHLAAKALDVFDVTESIDIARFIKKDFDTSYGPGWQCIVGTDFSSFVTHFHGCFIYFCIGSLAILLFRGAVGQPVLANLFQTLEALKA